MALEYREDSDLEFLQAADNEMLEILVKYLTLNEDGEERFNEDLTGNDEFREAKGDYQKVWRLIAAELQHNGGDTFVNIFRGTGVQYKEILIDICKKMKIKINESKDAYIIEQALLEKVTKDALTKMSQKEKAELEEAIGTSLSLETDKHKILAAIKKGGPLSLKVATYFASVAAVQFIGANALKGAGTMLATRAGMSFLGPVGVGLSVISFVSFLSGPAYRVLFPCVLQIAAMRQISLHKGKKEGFF